LEHILFFQILGIINPTDLHIFQRGKLNHQPDINPIVDSMPFVYDFPAIFPPGPVAKPLLAASLEAGAVAHGATERLPGGSSLRLRHFKIAWLGGMENICGIYGD
jgi:hypothetical protein